MSKQKPNLKRTIKNLRGIELPMSNPSKADLERIKTEKNITEVKIDDLPRETVRDVILNSLSTYKVTDRRDIFYVNQIASWVLEDVNEDENNELKDKLFNFLTEQVLPSAIIYKDEKSDPKKEQKQSGIYYGWVIAQVYDELGINE